MWYVIQVRTGTEEEIKNQCLKVISPDVLEHCFIPYYESMKRYHGEWHKVKNVLFPGYVFLVSDGIEELYYGLKKVIGLTKLLGTGNEVVPLYKEEIQFLEDFGAEKESVGISKGIIEGEEVVVLDGPLKGYEGFIKKIDRHKRLAFLEIELMGRKVETQVGLEIMGKNKLVLDKKP